jgi:hypothetical protein
VRGGAAGGSVAAAAEGARGVLVKDILDAEQQLQVRNYDTEHDLVHQSALAAVARAAAA